MCLFHYFSAPCYERGGLPKSPSPSERQPTFFLIFFPFIIFVSDNPQNREARNTFISSEMEKTSCRDARKLLINIVFVLIYTYVHVMKAKIFDIQNLSVDVS